MPSFRCLKWKKKLSSRKPRQENCWKHRKDSFNFPSIHFSSMAREKLFQISFKCKKVFTFLLSRWKFHQFSVLEIHEGNFNTWNINKLNFLLNHFAINSSWRRKVQVLQIQLVLFIKCWKFSGCSALINWPFSSHLKKAWGSFMENECSLEKLCTDLSINTGECYITADNVQPQYKCHKIIITPFLHCPILDPNQQ